MLATHNPPTALLRRQLDSIRSQTIEDWTCLIFDDSSTVRAEVEALSTTDPRFRLLPARARQGAYRAFELLMWEAANSVPVFLCDQDDYWYPDKMERMLATPCPAFCAMRVVAQDGKVLRERFVTPPESLTPAGILLMNVVSGAALKITPEVRQAALPFPSPQWRGWHDQWLATVALRLGKLDFIDAPLMDYTRHTGQVTGDGLRRLRIGSVMDFAARPQLRSRVRWVQAAAQALLRLPGPADPDLEQIAAGHFDRVLARHEIPRRRALLLRLGSLWAR